ncbi:hypothetical protein FNV43_RR10419 [Rhamnella rubrinervis]|uniref:Uncharacterized protein n=1 Tax=Rhamnella rubrinervis TaxID=2594499 RepID=A0A8K0HCM2_9ROSA|nr:hypothetical protein FNV43_RR10419 [Rhamnella rubrinervis]
MSVIPNIFTRLSNSRDRDVSDKPTSKHRRLNLESKIDNKKTLEQDATTQKNDEEIVIKDIEIDGSYEPQEENEEKSIEAPMSEEKDEDNLMEEPLIKKNEKEVKFVKLTQGKVYLVEYERKFEELSHYALYLIDIEDSKARRFKAGLRPDLYRAIVVL